MLRLKAENNVLYRNVSLELKAYKRPAKPPVTDQTSATGGLAGLL